MKRERNIGEGTAATKRLLLEEKPFGGHSVQLSLVAALVRHTQLHPPWHADAISAGRAQHDRRGKMKNRPVGVYSEPSDLSFFLPRGHTGGQGYSQFYSIDFHVTNRFFVTFFPEESNVPLVPPLTCTPAASPCAPRSCRRTGKRCRRWIARSADADPSARPDKCNPSSGF